MSDFAAARKHQQGPSTGTVLLFYCVECGDEWPCLPGLLLAELDRLKADLEVAESRKSIVIRELKERAEKAEAELAAERERAERLEKALLYLQKANEPCSAPDWCEHCFIAEALRPAAPDPTPSEELRRLITVQGKAWDAVSEQPDLPLHEYIPRPTNPLACKFCGQDPAAHRRKP